MAVSSVANGCKPYGVFRPLGVNMRNRAHGRWKCGPRGHPNFYGIQAKDGYFGGTFSSKRTKLIEYIVWSLPTCMTFFAYILKTRRQAY